MINFELALILTPSCDPSIVAKSPPGFIFIGRRSFCLLPTYAILKRFRWRKNCKALPFSEPKLLIGAEARFEREGELQNCACRVF
jgi:hypothetical protein